METKGSLTCSQDPATGTYPQPDESCPYHPTLLLQDPFLYYSPTYVKVFRGGLFPSGFPTESLYAFNFSPMCVTCHINLIVLDMIIRFAFGEDYKL
jgi:hypothetical protein